MSNKCEWCLPVQSLLSCQGVAKMLSVAMQLLGCYGWLPVCFC